MKLMQIYEKLSPDLKSKVGDVFFGEVPKFRKIQGYSKEEPNTEWENDLETAIGNWLRSPSRVPANYFLKRKDIFDKLSKHIPELLKPPIGDLAYRGNTISMDKIKAYMLTKKAATTTIAGKRMVVLNDFEYKPHRKEQSWTLDPKTAFDFFFHTGYNSKSTLAPVVYVTKITKDFIFNPMLLNYLGKGTLNKSEQEIIRIGNAGKVTALVPINVISWDSDAFIHLAPGAAPYFNSLELHMNTVLKPKKNLTISQMLKRAFQGQFSYDNEQTFVDGYSEATKKYINSLRKV